MFPDHWSFLLGEIALYSFVVLIATGTFLALFFDPSTLDDRLPRRLRPAAGAVGLRRPTPRRVHISLDVPAGLLIRQTHHWAALVFVAAIVVHLMRVVLHRRVSQAARPQLDDRR